MKLLSVALAFVGGGAGLAALSTVAPAVAQEYRQSRALDRDSAYHTNGNAFFVRGGFVFDSTEEFLDDLSTTAGLGDIGDTSVIFGSAGYRSKLARAGASMFALEGEIVVARETFDFDEAGVFVEYSEWNVAPQANLRWQYNFHGSVAPYASIGVGPTFAFYDADTSIGDFSADDVLFSYNGRAGLEFAISERVGIEGGYRYFGFTDAGTAGFHAGEVGLNFKF